jgi:endoglycosylceramidase
MDEHIALCFIAILLLAGIASELDGNCTCVPNLSSDDCAFNSTGECIGQQDCICIPSDQIPEVWPSDNISENASTISIDADPHLVLDKDGFHDSVGRLVYFRGVNMGSNAKLPPFLPFEDPRWWDLLSSWGYNMVRLTIFWEAVEPEPGVYDQEYLDKIEEMVDEASKRGIYVLLDMHQDQYSRCLKGDGAPYWALPRSVDPKDNSGIAGRFWFSAYFVSSDVRSSFANFFQSDDLKNHYYNSWKEVAKRVGNNPYVLGYDIMNEPFGGEIPNDNGEFENGFLKPFYQDAISSIREVDPDAIGFVEPAIVDLYASKLSPFDRDGLVYAAHLYRSLSWRAWLDPIYKIVSFDSLLDLQKDKANELNMPLFTGEFGVPWTTNPFLGRDRQVNEAMKALEENFLSNAYWDFSVENGSVWNEEDYSLLDDKGQPRGLEVNVRPYVRRLYGSPIYQSFDPYSKDYSLVFEGCSKYSCPVPTIIHVPEKVHYPGGFVVRISDGRVGYDKDRGELWYVPGQDGRHYVNISALNREALKENTDPIW